MKSSEPLRGFSGSRRYTLTVIPPLPQPVTTALAAGRLTHALCLEAPSPALLRDTAIALAGALLCRSGDGSLCGTCPACRKVLVGEHPDLMLYDPDEDKDIYKKESLRRLRAELYRTPVEAPRKVAILQLAERIPAEGQNLLLKIDRGAAGGYFFCFYRAEPLPAAADGALPGDLLHPAARGPGGLPAADEGAGARPHRGGAEPGAAAVRGQPRNRRRPAEGTPPRKSAMPRPRRCWPGWPWRTPTG